MIEQKIAARVEAKLQELVEQSTLVTTPKPVKIKAAKVKVAKPTHKNCPHCTRTINTQNYKKHVAFCLRKQVAREKKLKQAPNPWYTPATTYTCKYCSRKIKGSKNIISHENKCKLIQSTSYTM